jgi:hypothetical protein
VYPFLRAWIEYKDDKEASDHNLRGPHSEPEQAVRSRAELDTSDSRSASLQQEGKAVSPLPAESAISSSSTGSVEEAGRSEKKPASKPRATKMPPVVRFGGRVVPLDENGRERDIEAAKGPATTQKPVADTDTPKSISKGLASGGQNRGTALEPAVLPAEAETTLFEKPPLPPVPWLFVLVLVAWLAFASGWVCHRMIRGSG